jgi:uncharacterized protein
VLYVDSSALVKHYVRETGTDALNEIFAKHSGGQGIFISSLTYAEILAAFARRSRENPRFRKETELAHKQFQQDWKSVLTRIDLNDDVLRYVSKLVDAHPLRGADAVQLSSALWLRDTVSTGHSNAVKFACSDRQLAHAAQSEGLPVFNPDQP